MDPSGDPLDESPGALERVLEGSRYIMVVPVALLLLASIGAFVYGIVLFVDSTRRIVHDPFPVGRNVGFFLLLVDILLVGATLLIASLGFFGLFLSRHGQRDRPRPFPSWLVMNDLNDLKARVLSMIVLVSAVTFADVVVDFQTGKDVLYLGIGIAVVVLALTIFMRFSERTH
jgi:uncharacterized membrane protein YqhA